MDTHIEQNRTEPRRTRKKYADGRRKETHELAPDLVGGGDKPGGDLDQLAMHG